MPHSCKAISLRLLRLSLVAVAMTVAACEPYKVVEPGTQPIGDGMTVSKTKPWVHILQPFAPKGPDQVWTLDGIGLNALLLYGGAKDGDIPPPAYILGAWIVSFVIYASVTIVLWNQVSSAAPQRAVYGDSRFVEAVAAPIASAPALAWRLRLRSGDVLESSTPLGADETRWLIDALRDRS